MTEQEIMQWMREKVRRDGFSDAASLARAFLEVHEVTSSLDPVFSQTWDAGLKLAREIHGL